MHFLKLISLIGFIKPTIKQTSVGTDNWRSNKLCFYEILANYSNLTKKSNTSYLQNSPKNKKCVFNHTYFVFINQRCCVEHALSHLICFKQKVHNYPGSIAYNYSLQSIFASQKRTAFADNSNSTVFGNRKIEAICFNFLPTFWLKSRGLSCVSWKKYVFEKSLALGYSNHGPKDYKRLKAMEKILSMDKGCFDGQRLSKDARWLKAIEASCLVAQDINMILLDGASRMRCSIKRWRASLDASIFGYLRLSPWSISTDNGRSNNNLKSLLSQAQLLYESKNIKKRPLLESYSTVKSFKSILFNFFFKKTQSLTLNLKQEKQKWYKIKIRVLIKKLNSKITQTLKIFRQCYIILYFFQKFFTCLKKKGQLVKSVVQIRKPKLFNIRLHRWPKEAKPALAVSKDHLKMRASLAIYGESRGDFFDFSQRLLLAHIGDCKIRLSTVFSLETRVSTSSLFLPMTNCRLVEYELFIQKIYKGSSDGVSRTSARSTTLFGLVRRLILNLASYVSFFLNQILWKWAKKRHPKASRDWLINHYWVFIQKFATFYCFDIEL